MGVRVKYDAVVICDQIRPEANGKTILVGVMANDLAMPAFPTVMLISVYAEGQVLEAGEFLGTNRVEDEKGIVLYQGPPDSPMNFILGRFGQMMQLSINIPAPTVIRIICNVSGEDHTLISRAVVPFIANPPLPFPGGV